MGLKQRAVAAEEVRESIHPLAGLRCRLTRVRAAAARRSRRHRARGRCLGTRAELQKLGPVQSSSRAGLLLPGFALGAWGPKWVFCARITFVQKWNELKTKVLPNPVPWSFRLHFKSISKNIPKIVPKSNECWSSLKPSLFLLLP